MRFPSIFFQLSLFFFVCPPSFWCQSQVPNFLHQNFRTTISLPKIVSAENRQNLHAALLITIVYDCLLLAANSIIIVFYRWHLLIPSPSFNTTTTTLMQTLWTNVGFTTIIMAWLTVRDICTRQGQVFSNPGEMMGTSNGLVCFSWLCRFILS